MNSIFIGTASWTDKTLIDCRRFYPPTARSAEDRLRHYASQFPIVEVDSSYYGLPSVRNAQLWVERTPTHFVFNLKAFRLLTGHQTPPEALPRDMAQALAPQLAATGGRNFYLKSVSGEWQTELWRRFLEALLPLHHTGRLGLVLFQYAPWVVAGPEGRQLVENSVARMAQTLPAAVVGPQPMRMAVEFRHRSWFAPDHAESTLAWLRDLGVVHTVVDEPQGFANCIPTVWAATAPDLALLRLHGRNQATWNIRGAASSTSRFDHFYSESELQGLISPLRALSEQVGRMHVLFNTNFEDQGPVNARLLQSLLAS